MFSFLFAIPLIAHGLANLSGIFAPWTKGMLGFADASWLFSARPTYGSLIGRGFSLFWLASTLCLVAAGISIFQHRTGWIQLAIAGCLFSFIAIVPWWRAVPPGARFGAIFDLGVLIVLLSPLAARLAEAVQ